MTMYIAYNDAFGSSTAAMAGTSVASGATKVLLQLAAPATTQLRVVEWGVSFNGSAAAVPGVCELIQTATGVIMGTAAVMTPIGDSTTTTRLTGGITATTSGYGAATPGGVPSKYFDAQFIAPTSQYVKQWPLGREPVVAESGILQIRANVPVTVTALAYIIWEEC